MGSMPNWFAKTKEMAAFDRYFSTRDVDEKTLLDRYLQALARVQGDDFYSRADLLDTEWRGLVNRNQLTRMSLDEHFRGDWIHHQYPDDPAKFGQLGGRFWPQVASQDVIDRLRAGVAFAIHKAIGDTELANLGLPQEYRDRLWKAEVDNNIEVDDGIRGIALSWNCVAPAGDDYFEVEALRGPTVVEFAIATPRPYGHGSVMAMADDLRTGRLTLSPATSSSSSSSSSSSPTPSSSSESSES
jgi:hypothetical protein